MVFQGVFEDSVITSGKYYKEKEKVFEGKFCYSWGNNVVPDIYSIKSTSELTDRVRMMGWVNL